MRKKRIYRIIKWFFGVVLGIFMLISLLLYIFKDDICNLAIDELNKYLDTEVEVSEVELTFWSTFPNLSIDFNHVFVKDATPQATRRDTLLYSDLVRFKFNPFDAWNEEYDIKSLEIHKGVLNLRVDTLGNNNYKIFKDRDSVPEEDKFEMKLENVSFDDFRFNYINQATSQEYRTAIDELLLEGDLSNNVFTTQATSKLKIVAARSGKLTLVSDKPATLDIKVNVNTDSSKVEIPQSTILIANLPFSFDGLVDSTGFKFDMSAKDIGIEDVANNLAMQETDNIRKYSGTGSLLFDLKIEGKNEATSPVEIQCGFGVKKGTLRDPYTNLTLTQLTLDGKYSNVGGPEKEILELKNIGFKTKGGPFRGNLQITQFDAPVFKGNADGFLNLAVVRSLLNLETFQKLSGTVDIATQFVVKTNKLPDETHVYDIKKCEGQMKLHDATAQLKDDKRVYRNVNGLVYLRNDRIGLDDVSLKIGSSDFAIEGVFSKVVSYLGKRGSLVADVDIISKQIILEDLGSDSKEEKMQHQRTYILPDDIEGKVYLDVGRMSYDKHNFYNLKGNMKLKDRRVEFPRISVKSGGADVKGSLVIVEDKPEFFYISSQVASNNIDFKKLFHEWDNFKQDVIKSNNIYGTARANVKFEAPFDLRSGVISKAIEAKIGIEINDGRLKGVETFREITKSLKESTSARLAIGKENINAFEQKLLDLSFNKLENTLLIRDGVITIPTMSVESSALDIELSGKHTFDNKIDYRFGFRFRDLKQKEQSEFGEIIDDGTGKYVFMRMYGDLYNPSIEWDDTSSKEHRKENIEAAKQDARSILKTEFGLFKNDTTVQEYIQVRRPHEQLEVIDNPTDENEDILENSTPKREGKIKKWLKKEGAKIKEESGEGEDIIFE